MVIYSKTHQPHFQKMAMVYGIEFTLNEAAKWIRISVVDATSPGHRHVAGHTTRTEARCDTGVSKTIVFGTPKSNEYYHHGSYEQFVIWGYCILYFWTYPYL